MRGLREISPLNCLLGPLSSSGLQEVHHLEKMREKRAFEATLPPIDDLAQLPLRQKMIEEWEAQEWRERGEEIQGVQDQRLEILEQAIQVICRHGE